MKKAVHRREGLDTSFVLRLLVGEPVDQAQAAVAHLDLLKASGKQAVVNDLVVSETYFALQHHYGVPKQVALDHLRQLLESPEIEAAEQTLALLQQPGLGKAKPGFVDRLIHAHYLTEAGGMATFEKAAAKLPKVVIPPRV